MATPAPGALLIVKINVGPDIEAEFDFAWDTLERYGPGPSGAGGDIVVNP